MVMVICDIKRYLMIINRLDEANDQTLMYQNEMKSHKQNAVQLEKIIGKMRLEGSQNKSTSGQLVSQSAGLPSGCYT